MYYKWIPCALPLYKVWVCQDSTLQRSGGLSGSKSKEFRRQRMPRLAVLLCQAVNAASVFWFVWKLALLYQPHPVADAQHTGFVNAVNLDRSHQPRACILRQPSIYPLSVGLCQQQGISGQHQPISLPDSLHRGLGLFGSGMACSPEPGSRACLRAEASPSADPPLCCTAG